MDGANVAAVIDHAYLGVSSHSSVKALRAAVDATIKHGFRSLCLPPVLAGTVKKNFPTVRVAAVLSYPLGSDLLAAKTFAVQQLITLGVDELDIVYDLFALVNSNWDKLKNEAETLGGMTERSGIYHKAIIETPILTDEQVATAAEVLRDSPVDCVKTSTGYHREPTTIDQVKLLAGVLAGKKHIKASGGIRTYHDLRSFVDAGADIIGTSSGVAIVAEAAE
jgi:deoxyribose-phosphate aldolase